MKDVLGEGWIDKNANLFLKLQIHYLAKQIRVGSLAVAKEWKANELL